MTTSYIEVINGRYRNSYCACTYYSISYATDMSLFIY